MDKRTLRSKKSKVRNARTYDRQNQSIFGKVCSTVKGLLNPSWLLSNVSQWMGNSEQEPDNIENETIKETDNDIISQSVSHGNKRIKLKLEDYMPSIQNSGTQTWPEHASTQNLYPSSQNSLLSTKESLAGLNGDNHSENSEESASTSGCSSLVSSNNRLMDSHFQNLSDMKNSRKRKVEPTKSSIGDVNNSRTLWSSHSARFQRRLPIISSTNQPNFNLSSFIGPSKLNNAMENKVSSPFYEGKTTFGGASSSRKITQNLAPYQILDKPLRNQIKVRENPPEDGLEGMSSAAKRILLTLEKMSTPIADAKKIPNSNTSPVDLSLYLAPPKSKRNSQFTPSISKGPPIANINTIAKLATLKNYGIKRLQSTILNNPVLPSDQTNTLLQSSTSEANILKTAGGKMRNKLSQCHQSTKNLEEMPEALSLPSVPLPISSLPTISFGKKCDMKMNSQFSSAIKDFTFSNPIEHDLTVSNTTPASYVLKPFVFSNPIEIEFPNAKEVLQLPINNTVNCNVTTSVAEWECSSCWVRNPSHKTACLACETPKNGKSDSISSAAAPNLVSSKSFPLNSRSNSNLVSSATWECSTCWVKNPVSESNCLACKTSMSTTHNTITSSSNLDSSATWECSACWVRNPGKESTCLACKTSRSTTQHITSVVSTMDQSSRTWECRNCLYKNPVKENKCIKCEIDYSVKRAVPGKSIPAFKPSSWECSSCWVTNPMKEKKCLACETIRPEKDASPSSKSIPVFKPSTWECSSCWVTNPMKEKKCLACETLHPEKDASPISKGGFKFSSPIQSSPITFKFGNHVSTIDSASPFNFNTTNSKSEKADSPGFQFVSSSDKLSTSTFKFGTSTISTSVSSCTSSTSTSIDASKMSEVQKHASNSAGIQIPSIHISTSDSKESSSFTNGGISTTNRSNTVCAKKFDAPNSLSASTLEVPNSVSDANVFKFVAPNSSISVADSTLGFKFKVPNTAAENIITSSVNSIFGTSEISATTSNFNVGGNSTMSVTPTISNFDAENKAETSTFKFVAPSTSTVNAIFSSSASTAINKTSLSLPTTSSSTSTTLSFKSGVANIATENLTTSTSVEKFRTSEHCSTIPSFSLAENNTVPISVTPENFCAANGSETVASTFKFNVPSTTSTNAFIGTSTTIGKTSEATLTTFTTSSFKFGVASTPTENTTTTSILNVKFGTSSENCTTAGSTSIPVTTTCSNFGTANESGASSSFQFLTPSSTSVNTFNTASSGKSSEALLATSVFKTAITTVATNTILQPEPNLNNVTSAPSTVLTTSVFKFGAVSTVSDGIPTTSVFKFGTASVDTTSASSFKFGIASNATNSFFSTTTPITTSIAVPSNANKAPEASGPTMCNTGFKISSTSMGTTNLKHHEPSSTIFGSSQTGFMSKDAEKAPTASTGGFLFGAPKSEPQATVSFDFGSNSVSSNTSVFSCFQPLQPANPNFQFGSQPIGHTTSAFGSTSSFTFTKASEVNPVSSLPNPVLAFGSPSTFSLTPKTDGPSQMPCTISHSPALPFGSPSVAFSFGNKVDSVASQNPTPTFGLAVFGNAATPSFSTSDKPASSGFTFGTSSSNIFQFGVNSEKKPVAAASGFTFGTPTHPETNSSFSGGFTMNTPPSFNFGATSTPAGPFQFAAPTPETTANTQAVPRKYRKAVRRVRKD